MKQSHGWEGVGVLEIWLWSWKQEIFLWDSFNAIVEEHISIEIVGVIAFAGLASGAVLDT